MLIYPFALTFPLGDVVVDRLRLPVRAMEHYTPRTTSRNTGRSRSPTRWACGCARRICANTTQAHSRLVTPTSASAAMSTFLHQQRTELTAAAKSPATPARRGPADHPAKIHRYAAVGGDHRPRSPIAGGCSASPSWDVHCRGGIGGIEARFRAVLFGSVRQAGAARQDVAEGVAWGVSRCANASTPT